MFTVFFPINDDEEIEISRQDVLDNDDVPEMQEWHQTLTELIVQLVYQAKAVKEFGGSDRDAAYKLGKYRQAQDWIAMRLHALGYTVEREMREIDKLQASRDSYKTQLEDLQARVRKATSGLLGILA